MNIVDWFLSLSLGSYTVETLLAIKLGPNSLGLYFYAFFVFLLFFAGIKLFQILVIKRLENLSKNTKNDYDDLLIRVINDIPSVFLYLLAVYFPLRFLTTSESIENVLHGVFIVIIVFQGVRSASILIKFSLEKYMSNGRNAEQSKTALHGINLLVSIALWVVGILLVISNLGFNVTSLVTSLGIGGIAVALAAQNILADIFSSFTLYFDRPFEIGDFVKIGDTDSGTVKKIGIKTTRIKTPQGQELVVSNQELTSTRVQNFKKLKKRRVVLELGLEYNTSNEKLKLAKKLIEEIVKKHEILEFDRAHFSEFGPSSLILECVYFVISSDFKIYMDAKQEVNFEVKEALEKAKIEIAYPTQTLVIKK